MLDYAAIMRGGQALVPNLREQMLQDRQLDQQQGEIELRRQLQAAKVAEAQQAERRQQEFAEAMDHALTTGNPSDMQRVRMMFPEFTKDLKDGFDSLDEEQKRITLTQLGSVRARLAAGDVTGARAIVARRHEADKASGTADEDTEELLALLDKGDPESLKLAQGTLTFMLAAADPDKFAETFGKLEPSDSKTGVQKEYEWRVGAFGQAAADEWLATQDESLVTVEPGGSVYRKSDFVTRGGGPNLSVGGGIVATAEQEAESQAVARRLGVGGVAVSDGPVVMPVEGGSFGQGAQQYGASRDGGSRAHNGLDISGVLGAPVRAIAAGTVVAVGNEPRSGKFVRVKHPDGTITSYAHLGSQGVKVGDSLAAGASLGSLGRSGNAHAGQGRGVLHLVVRRNGRTIDPRPLLKGAGPVRVASRQQYERLPSGTHYIAPDGSSRVKP